MKLGRGKYIRKRPSSCKKCGEPKTDDEWYSRMRGEKKIVLFYCVPCWKQVKHEQYLKTKAESLPKKKAWREANPELAKEIKRKTVLKTQFGLSVEVWDQMFADQNGCCAICGIPQEKLKIRLAVDHNHVTGKVRGLLCSECNNGIGKLKDNIGILQKAIAYLQRNDMSE